MMRAGPASGLEGKLSPDRGAKATRELVWECGEPPREVASCVEFAGAAAAMSGDWQQFRSGAEVPSLSFTACLRSIQRELPSTLTNGQKVGRMFQRKMFHAAFTFFDW